MIWNNIKGYIIFICTIVFACVLVLPVAIPVFRQQRQIDVEVCYINKDTATYTTRYCDVSNYLDVLEIKMKGQRQNIPLHSIENYVIKEK